MYVKSKAVLTAYGKLSEIEREIEGFVTSKALGGFYDNRPTLVLFNEIADLIEKKNLVAALIVTVKKALKRLTDDERKLLYAWKSGKRDNLYISLRHYFRVSGKAFAKFDKALSDIGLTDETFEDVYIKKIPYLAAVAYRFKIIEEGSAKRLKKLELNKSFKGGSIMAESTEAC